VRALSLAGFAILSARLAFPSCSPLLTNCTYFVSPEGNDSNPGDLSRHFRTIRKAASIAKAGNTICVDDGVYRESVWLHKSGSPRAWITFRSLHVHGAHIAPPDNGSGNDAFNLNSQSYVTISGFDLTAGRMSSGVAAGWGGLGHHTRVIGNVIHDTGASGIQLNSGDYRAIENNIVYRCAFWAPFDGSGISIYEPRAFDAHPGYHNVIRNNITFANDNLTGPRSDGNGIVIDDTRFSQNRGVPYRNRTLVESNLSFGNGGNGIEVYYSDYVRVRNNTAYWNNRRLDSRNDRAELANVSSSHVEWVNNIAWTENSSEYAILDRGFVKNIVWASNMTFSTATDAPSVKITDGSRSRVQGKTLFGLDPKLTRPGLSLQSDFRPTSSSPAIGGGVRGYGFPRMDLNCLPHNQKQMYLGAYGADLP
jgi:parallel beta-helix repeat protein